MYTIVLAFAAAGIEHAGGLVGLAEPAVEATYVPALTAWCLSCAIDASVAAVGDVDCTSLPSVMRALTSVRLPAAASAPVRQPSSAPQRTPMTPDVAGDVTRLGSAAT